MKRTYKKGEVIYAELGSPPNEVKGHEQANCRPCIVIADLSSIGLLIIVPVSTKKPKFQLFTIVGIPKGNGGLTEDSYALCHQIRAISTERLKNSTGTLSSIYILKVHTVLKDLIA